MGFDLKAFEKTDFTRRIGEVEAPALKAFFGEDEKPIFTFRNLDSNELAIIGAENNNVKISEGLLNAISAKSTADIAKEVKTLLGFDGELQPEYRRKLSMVELASVEPKLTRQMARKIAEHYSHVFTQFIDKINELYGKGSEMGKLQASTKTPKSKTL